MHTAVLTFDTSLTGIVEANASFDAGVLRIAYPGRNRNNTSISKEAFERSLPSIRNCPVVCRYDRETDSFGGHDVEVVREADGELSLRNLTEPVGVIPESARQWWETVTEEDGTAREYLHTDVLLWKRQEAYGKLKRDGVAKHSMEIAVRDASLNDGVLEIRDFEFTAFVLIGVEPCFESSALELFSLREIKAEMEEMMCELKGYYAQKKGGEEMEKKTDGIPETEIFEAAPAADDDACKTEQDEAGEPAEPETDETADGGEDGANREAAFALAKAVREALERALDAGEKLCREWGAYPRYWLEDFDQDAGEVYAWDREDFNLFGFRYVMDGDNAVIDFATKAKKKYVIADFDEGGNTESPFLEVFNAMKAWCEQNAECRTQLEAANERLRELEAFKLETEKETLKRSLSEVLGRFSALKGIDAFDALSRAVSDGTAGMSADELEEKCYAIAGRFTVRLQPEQKSPKIVVDRSDETENEVPYGGIVEDYMHRKTGGK